MKDIFETDYDVKRIIPYLNIEVGFSITPNDTLIIFDEIQNAPKAFESLKYFCEDAPEYHIIVARHFHTQTERRLSGTHERKRIQLRKNVGRRGC